MPNPLVECIPNFSEARRPEVVDAIANAISAIQGATVLDIHSDLDHNRSVVTFVGSPFAVEEAAFQAIKTASTLIDLDHHTGEHPRIGATDVLPFVPIRETSMQECVDMARRLGRRVGDELGIPVYLYEEAATRLERKNLEDIRRGEYELLKEEIGHRPERNPDFGPAKVGKAGATVIGARQPLIAFNVYLTTDDVSIAKKIAKAIRNSSGGLHYVKALGLLVEGRAQVSMNLTNFRQTPLARVVEMIRREAERYGVSIYNSELVGLIPQEALVDAAVWYMQMDKFAPEQILEHKLQNQLMLSGGKKAPTVESSFIAELAQGTPTPGGGAAAAYAGATAAALVAMVARITVGKKKYAGVAARMQQIIETADDLRDKLSQASLDDAAAYQQIIEANRLPRDTPDDKEARLHALENATQSAIEVPLRVMQLATSVLRLAVEVALTGNSNAISDAASAAALARASLIGSSLNVRINCANLQNHNAVKTYLAEVRALLVNADELENELKQILDERGNLSPLS